MEIDFQKYRPEEILTVIEVADWSTAKDLRREWEKHRDDWVEETGATFSLEEFLDLQDKLIEQAREGLADIVFFLHKKRPQLALRSDLRHGRRVLKDAALMYDIDKNERVGFYRRSMTSLRRQEEAVVIRER